MIIGNNLEFLLICLFAGTAVVRCHHINDTYRLLQHKLTHYDKTIRPINNQSDTTVVKFSFVLMSLHDLDEVNQRLSVVAIMGLQWKDDLMKWNPADYGNMTNFVTDSSRFWTPELLLLNNADMTGNGGTWLRQIRFTSRGNAYSYPVELFSVSCEMDVTFYPWDRHICRLSFIPKVYLPSEMRLKEISSKAEEHFYSENGAWKYIDSSISSETAITYSSVSVTLVFERKPRFAIINVILPIIFMSFLSVVVFLIPPDSGERISYTITILLAIAVFLTLIGDNLPKTSNPMPLFSYYLIAMLTTSICITLATIFSLRLYHDGDSATVRGRWAKLGTWWKRKRRLRQAFSFDDSLNERKTKSEYKINDNENTCDTGETKFNVPSMKCYDQGELRNSKLEDEKCTGKSEEDNISWKDISGIVDKVFLLIFFSIFLVLTAVYLGLGFRSKPVTIDEYEARSE